jgi:hypothetical protein
VLVEELGLTDTGAPSGAEVRVLSPPGEA